MQLSGSLLIGSQLAELLVTKQHGVYTYVRIYTYSWGYTNYLRRNLWENQQYETVEIYFINIFKYFQ